jgi:hypothetical protein
MSAFKNGREWLGRSLSNSPWEISFLVATNWSTPVELDLRKPLAKDLKSGS